MEAGLAGPEALIGTRAQPWTVADWINSEPLDLADLRGKAVLVRWWTAPDCPFCRATAPALEDFWQRYRERGLMVVGFYHHKASTPLDTAAVARHIRDFGFTFPVAIDHDWRTLRHWWLEAGGNSWTSVTFLIDRRGVVRHIHPGGQYVAGDADYRILEAAIEDVLAEEAPTEEGGP